MHPSINKMWSTYRASITSELQLPNVPPSYWHFCDNQPDADSLVELVLRGQKQATASSLWYLESSNEKIPALGDLHVVTNWEGIAKCILETTSVQITPFNLVGEKFARAEGEGDLSLEFWREVHWEYFKRELASVGRVRCQEMPIVCESFVVQWPITVA
jgi:uncharacterized protein YhfF